MSRSNCQHERLDLTVLLEIFSVAFHSSDVQLALNYVLIFSVVGERTRRLSKQNSYVPSKEVVVVVEHDIVDFEAKGLLNPFFSPQRSFDEQTTRVSWSSNGYYNFGSKLGFSVSKYWPLVISKSALLEFFAPRKST